jgi:hypothetical protein
MAVAPVKATVRTLVGGGRVRQPATAAKAYRPDTDDVHAEHRAAPADEAKRPTMLSRKVRSRRSSR